MLRLPLTPFKRHLAQSFGLCAMIGVAACATNRDAAVPLVRHHAERDLDCPGADIRITQEQFTGYYNAIGCGRKARYRAACEGLSCTVSPEGGPAIPWRDRPPPTPVPQ